MFDIDFEKLALVGLVALVVIGPKDLPRAMRILGQWIGRARRMANHFRSGLDEMIRQSELEEMEAKWAEENARIMREHPIADYTAPAVPRVEEPPVMRPLPAPAAVEAQSEPAHGSAAAHSVHAAPGVDPATMIAVPAGPPPRQGDAPELPLDHPAGEAPRAAPPA